MYRYSILWLSVFFMNCLLPSARAQQKSSLFQEYEQKIPNSGVSFKMIPIPAGVFMMGSPQTEQARRKDEGPALQVAVDSFWMEEHEVTYEEYIMFQQASRDNDPKPDGITRPSPPYVDFTLGMGKIGGFPANSMTQYAAIMYCKWLYHKTNIFYRLPTEAEWEYACRTGSEASYPFGQETAKLGKYAWYRTNSDNKYHAVKQLQPNAWGLYDMLGNVAEWTLDQYEPDYFEKINTQAINPQFPHAPESSVALRGGSFLSDAADLRSAARIPSEKKWNARDPQIPKSKWWNTDAPFIGFRVIRPVTQPSREEAENFFTRFLMTK